MRENHARYSTEYPCTRRRAMQRNGSAVIMSTAGTNQLRNSISPARSRRLVDIAIVVGGTAILGVGLTKAGLNPGVALRFLHQFYPAWHTDTLLLCSLVAMLGLALLDQAHRYGPKPNAADRQPHDAASPIDTLTGLPSRAKFRDAIASMLAAGLPGGVLVMDLDGLRTVPHGDSTSLSDVLLQEFAGSLSSLAPVTSHLARLQNDEFAVLVPGADASSLQAEASLLLRGLSAPFALAGRRFELPVSIGAAMLPDHGSNSECVLRAALLALQQAKAAGGGACRMFEPTLASAMEARSELRAEFRASLAAGQVVPYYQPIVSLLQGNVVGFEVLARWRHPERGVLAPDLFIPLAEEQNLLAKLSLCLLRQVIADAKHWPVDWTFAFNAAPSQLRDLVEFVRDRKQIPADMLSPRRLELELTENALIKDIDLARELVTAMHKHGTKVVLDDFGTGYANFLHLRDIPFDRIKIDRAFVRDMLEDTRTEACVRAMLALGESLGVSVTAEGVETAAAAARLRDMGCDFAQGYHFSPPVPASAVPQFAAQPVCVG
jgi:diguanylate cyclase (GGDEF)-like protein